LSLQQQLEAIRINQALSEREKREEEAKRKRVCANCGEETSVDHGIDCPTHNMSHFLCSDCFSGYAKFQFDALETFKEHGCALICDQCHANDHVTSPYSEQAAVPHMDRDTYAQFQSAKLRVHEREVAERVRRETEERIKREIEDAKSKAGRVLIHKKHIEGTLLATQCPGCKGTILDFDACFAVTCVRGAYGGCGCQFCAFCLVVCKSDAHAHVANCMENPRRGQRDAVFCEGAEFERRNKERMQVHLIETHKYTHIHTHR
jgi:hypothetical protein